MNIAHPIEELPADGHAKGRAGSPAGGIGVADVRRDLLLGADGLRENQQR
jgi:hypothetical protein